MRLRGAFLWQLYFWAWDYPLGYYRVYYDGWNNQLNFGFFCIGWITPPLEHDLYEEDEE